MSGGASPDSFEAVTGKNAGELKEIGSVTDGEHERLTVDAKISGGAFPPVPQGQIIPFTKFLVDGASKSMVVDGSGTPVVYSIGPTGSEVWYVYGLRIALWDTQVRFRNNFGNQTALTNGLLTEWQLNGTDYEIANVKDNSETLAVYRDNSNDTSTGNNMATENSLFTGFLRFPPTKLIAGDKLKTTVQDDLSLMKELLMVAKAYKVI